MQYSIENDILRLTVDSHGAEPVSVIHKPTGAELLWQADPAVWKRHAPILFPVHRQADRRQNAGQGCGVRRRSARLCPRCRAHDDPSRRQSAGV